MTDHAELRRLAKAATPGARYQGTDERVIVAGNGTIICTVSGAISGPSVMADAEFLCATDPKTILALLDEIDSLKAENEALLLGMRAIINAYDYADQHNKEGVSVEVMEDLRTLFKGATQ
ncbi:ead/Ea22-like family protein [Pseudomonas aeruginosa]|uniref:ead/Ea22-like family protein n=1 Tax=Pseudomonas aeruginosa TaxID=287 RepID=UPI0029C005CE|nr:ead/Ea22-like family protein [Pseudomonas aeruginosa]